jgi:hypothetical protein
METRALLPDIEIRVARFLGLPLSNVRDPATALRPQIAPGAKLRRVRDLDRDRFAPALHSAMQVAGAVVRSMRVPASNPEIPPRDGLAWRNELGGVHTAVKLDHILDDLWQRGIPVIPLDLLPSPSFQGLACIVEGRRNDSSSDCPGRHGYLVDTQWG